LNSANNSGRTVVQDWWEDFAPAFLQIAATGCNAVRPAVAPKAFGAMARQACLAEGWQKDKPGRKMGFSQFSRPSIFPPFRSLPPVRHGLNGSFIRRTLHLKYHIVNRFLKEFFKKL
jgi:hypothetical protein